MIGVLFLFAVVGSSVWVYADASNRDFAAGGGVFRSALTWLVACLLLWVVAFPVYLAKRGNVPRKQRPS